MFLSNEPTNERVSWFAWIEVTLLAQIFLVLLRQILFATHTERGQLVPLLHLLLGGCFFVALFPVIVVCGASSSPVSVPAPTGTSGGCGRAGGPDHLDKARSVK